jgi:hypothetical protein
LLEGKNSVPASGASITGIIPLTGAALIVCCTSLAILIGEIGFQGDDWWQFSWPYWHSFPNSIWEYAKASRRPIEGLYTVLSFEIFGLNRVLFTLSALLLSAGSCLLMGACLNKAFPSRKTLVVLAVFFGFLLTPLSNLIYMFHTDNSRLSMLLFWTALLAFQHWAGGSKSWLGLMLPVILYLAASLTYENATFLIFAVPFFVWPIHVNRGQSMSDRSFALRLGAGITVSFAVFVFVRFGLFGGGAVGHRSLVPSFNLVSSYVYNMMLYTMAPFREVSWDPAAWVWACPVALLAAALVFRASREDSAVSERPAGWTQSPLYIAALGIAILVLGMLPYLLASYNPSMGFTSQSRVYSSATFGLAILFALLFSASKNKKILFGTKVIAVGMIGLMAVFLADLRNGWQEAAARRGTLLASLLRHVPGVKPGTTFLLMDAQSYVSKGGMDRAVVFQGVDGIGEFVRMLYAKKDLYAYFLYSKNQVQNNTEGEWAAVSPAGITARGSAVRPPIPLDSLLILKREGSNLVLLDKLSAKDESAAIKWKGVQSMHSNPDLIVKTSDSKGIVERMSIR